MLERKALGKSYKGVFHALIRKAYAEGFSSGEGGVVLLENAKEVLHTEFPELYEKVTLNIPDEKARRVGQSVAAASLPQIR